MNASSQTPAKTQNSHEEVRPDELLMRRILPRKKDYHPSRTPSIQETAFWPRPNDVEGLSLSRRRTAENSHFLDENQFKAACSHPDANLRLRCGVCAVLVAAAQAIGLQVRPDPIIPDDPGHVYLPDINYLDFDRSPESRQKILIWVGQLIEIASQNILILPGTSLQQTE